MLKNSKYLYGANDVFVPANLNFGEFMLDNFWRNKDKIALINGSTHELTKYGQLAQEATNLAVSLRRLGVRKGDVVAIMSENRREYFAIFVAIAAAGGVVTTFNPLYTEGEIKHVISISKPKYIFCTIAIYKHHEKILKSNKHIRVIVIGDETINNNVTYNDLAVVKNNNSSIASNDSRITKNVSFEELDVVDVLGQVDTLVILYSSGTTGLPKGVMLTHLNITTMCKSSSIDYGDGIVLTIGPWFHAMGLVGAFTGFYEGKTFAFLPKFDVGSMLATVGKYKVEMVAIVPAVVIAITKSQEQFDFSSVRRVMCGAAPMHKDTAKEFALRFPEATIIQGYGMTESSLAIAKNVFKRGKAQENGTVGTVLSNTIIKIVDTETRVPLGPNQNGEICFKGAMLMKGYVGKDQSEDFDDEGFLKTGDVGYYDNEGNLYVVDRLKELIKYKANQVAPAELEALLLQHNAVREVGVVGLLDRAAGELPLAFIALQPGKTASEREIQQFVAERVSNPKHLRGGVRFLDEIPKTSTGKILRKELRKMANSGISGKSHL